MTITQILTVKLNPDLQIRKLKIAQNIICKLRESNTLMEHHVNVNIYLYNYQSSYHAGLRTDMSRIRLRHPLAEEDTPSID